MSFGVKGIAVQNKLPGARQTELLQGWALKQKKGRTVFSKRQKQYMMEIFDSGKKTGRKIDPYIAAEEMRTMKTDDNKFMFSRNEYLTGQQIASYFSCLAVKDRQMDSNDFLAAEEEIKKEQLKDSILETVSV